MTNTTEANTRADRLNRLAAARLYVLTDGAKDLAEFQQRISVLVANGVDIIQLREKRLTDEAIAERIEQAVKIIRAADSETLLILNDRPDLAAKYPVDGVHVGQEDISPIHARTIIGLARLLGVSTHNIKQAQQAMSNGADYVGAGPTFSSPTKSFSKFPGLEFLTQVATLELPVFAIGGINIENVQAVLNTGITRIATSSSVVGAMDMGQAVRSLKNRLRPAANPTVSNIPSQSMM